MAYIKTQWKDQVVENPRTYSMRNNGDDTVTMLDAFGTVTELGTPVNAANMNKIENELYNLDTTKADDNAVVHIAGAETITGTKIFAGNGSVTYLKNTSVTYNTTPASNNYTNMVFVDKDGAQIGAVGILRDTNNYTTITLNARGANGDWSGQALRLTVAPDGTATASAPEPTVTTTTSSLQIATAGWVNSTGNNVVHKTGAETIAGTKTFSSTIAGSINGNAATVTNGVYTTGNQTIGGTKTFSATAYGKASDAANSMLTTVAKSKGSSGYFKLGNGMIVQWGSWAAGNSVDTVTFPIPFTAIPKVIGQINYNSTSGQSGITEKSTTSFKVYHASGISGDYIAIGY